MPRGTRAQITDATLQQSYIWENIRKVRLQQNMRAQGDEWYSDFFLRIGNRTEVTYTNDYVQLPDDIVIEYESHKSIDNLIEHRIWKKKLDVCILYGRTCYFVDKE